MADDLLRRGALKRMTRSEVVSLLGPPLDTPYFKGTDMIYMLGPERGWLSIDSEWLLIDLDQRGRVASARLATD
jgi:hypothetical protein